MDTNEKYFKQVAELLDQQQSGQALRVVTEFFRDQGRFPEMFEAMKAAIREELNLPIIFPGNSDNLPEETQLALESRLLDACREVGSLILQEGNVAEAWMYLRPLSDTAVVREMIESVSVSDENMTEVIDVALYQFAAPQFGFRLLLENQGTCNGITFFDTQATYQPTEVRNPLAEVLVTHVYNELCATVGQNILEHKKTAPVGGTSLKQLIENRDWLFESCGHHLDVTHLAAVVRIARFCECENTLRMANELCGYGIKLDKELHYEGEAPFESTYLDHRYFFEALLLKEPDQAASHFRSKLKSYEKREQEPAAPGAWEATRLLIIELMSRSGSAEAAVNEAIQFNQLVADNQSQLDIATMLDLTCNADQAQDLMSYYLETNDLLGFSLSGIRKSTFK